MKVSNARPLRTPTPGAKALFIGCVLSGTLLVSCSERDSVTKEPEPGTDTGTLELSIELRPSQIVQGRPGNTGDSGGAGGSAGVDGGAGAGGSAGVDGSVIGTSFGSGDRARRAGRSGAGDPLALTVTIFRQDDPEPVSTESRTLDPGAVEASVTLDLPAGDLPYSATIRVDGSRSRPTGVTDTGILHLGTTEPFLITKDNTTSASLSLADLVPQLWLRETPGVSHELHWSPVEGAASYTIRRVEGASLPILVSSASLDTTFVLPPGRSAGSGDERDSGGTVIEYRVQARLPGGTLSAFSESQSANDPGQVPPADITDLAALQITSNQVVLEWTAPGDDGNVGRATAYDLRRSTAPIDAANFPSAARVPTFPPAEAGNGEFAVVAGLEPESTYHFAIVTEDDAGNRSGLSNPLTVTLPLPLDTAPPTPVTDLTASAPSEGVVELTWSAPGDERDGAAASYEIRYAAGSLSSASFPAATSLSEAPTPGAPGSEERITVTDLPPGDWAFALRSRDSAGNVSLVSNAAEVSTRDLVAPDAITDLTVSAAGDGTVRLRWSASGDNGRIGRADRQEIRWADSPIDTENVLGARVADNPPSPGEPGTLHEFELSGLRAETRYWFAVLTYDEVGNRSGLSNPADLTTEDFEAPNPVLDLVAEEVTGKRARLFFTAPGDNGADGTATRYDLRFSAQPITEDNFDTRDAVGNMPAPAPGGTNEEVTLVASAAVEVYLALKTEDEVGNVSPLSNSVFVRFGDTPPDAPTALSTVANGPDRIRLEWRYPGGEDYFEVERRAEGEESFRRIGIVNRNGLLRTESGGIEIVMDEGDAAAAPNDNRPVDPPPHRVTLIAESGSPGGRGESQRPDGAGDETVAATNIGLTERTAYTYRLRAFGPGGPSAYSNEATSTTLLAAPSEPGATADGATRIHVTWEQTRNPDRFLVQRSSHGSDFETRDEVAGGERSWVDDEVTPRTTYSYRIRSRAGLEDAVSNEVSATTGDETPACAIDPVEVEFGPVSVGESLSRPILITNVGGGRLVGSVVAECSDFLVEEAPFDLGPGESAVREVLFRPTSAGRKVCSLAISGGCEAVQVSGTGESAAICSVDGELNDFGQIPPRSFSLRSFTIANVGGGLLTGAATISEDEADVFEIVAGAGTYALGAGETHEIRVRYRPLGIGSYEALLDFGNGDCPPIAIFGSTTSSGVCIWSGEDIDFGSVPIGGSASRRWAIHNSGTEPIAGVLLPTCDSAFTLTSTGPFNLAPGESFAGFVFFDPTEAREYRCEILADMTLGSECPPLLVDGRGSADASCGVSASRLDFGTVEAGNAVTRTVTLTNGGVASLDVSAFLNPRCSGGVFEVVEGGGARSIPGGSTLDIVIRFQSDDSGQEYLCDISFGNELCAGVELEARTVPLPCEQTPSAYDFGTVLVGETYVRNFTITNRTATILSGFLEADCQAEVAKVPEEDAQFDLRPGESHPFRFLLAPTLGAGDCEIWAGNLACERIPVSWNGEFPNPACSVSASEVTVEAAIGETTITGFEITNEGNTSLFLDVQFRQPEGCAPLQLVAGGGESRLDPGQTLTVKLLYEPVTSGATLCHVLPLVDGRLVCGPVAILGTALE